MSEAIVDNAHAFLRAHSKADLRFDEHVRPIKYVVLADGRIAAPVMVAMLQAVDTVLFVPEWVDDALEVQVTLEEFQERGPAAEGGGAADRWRIYHGEPEDVRWAFLHADAARFEGMVVDGEALPHPNPLAAAEAAICREMNAQLDALRKICERFGGMTVEAPVMVGIDASGFDVRARFDVLRVQAPEPVSSAAAARKMLERMKLESSQPP